MRITKFIAVTIINLILFAACADDQFDGIELPSVEAGEGYLSVALVDATGTRSSSDDEASEIAKEREIKTIEFFIFDANGNQDASNNYYSLDNSEENQYTFPILAGENKTVLVLINYGLGPISGNLSAVKAIIYNSEIENPLEVSASGMPMSGEMSRLNIKDGDIKVVPVSVSRTYAKFDAPTVDTYVTVNLTNEDKTELNGLLGQSIVGAVKFDLKGYYVVNGLKKTYTFPNYGGSESDRWNSSVWQLGNNLNNYTKTIYNTDSTLYKAYSGSDYLTQESVYLYENCPLEKDENGLTVFSNQSVYAMIIKADLYDSLNTTNRVERYWRINVSKTTDADSVYKILRNAIYKTNIKNVTTIGYGTPKEAEEEKPEIPGVGQTGITVDIDIAKWQIFDLETDI